MASSTVMSGGCGRKARNALIGRLGRRGIPNLAVVGMDDFDAGCRLPDGGQRPEQGRRLGNRGEFFRHPPVEIHLERVAAAVERLDRGLVHGKIPDLAQALLPAPENPPRGKNRLRLAARDVAHQIKNVAGHVNDDTAVLRAPVHGRLRADLPDIRETHDHGFPRHPLLEHLPEHAESEKVAVLEARHEDDAAVTNRPDHALSLFEGQRQRLLSEDMPPVLGRKTGHVRVQMRGQRLGHHIDPLMHHRLAPVLINFCPCHFRHLPRAPGIPVAHRHNPRAPDRFPTLRVQRTP